MVVWGGGLAMSHCLGRRRRGTVDEGEGEQWMKEKGSAFFLSKVEIDGLGSRFSCGSLLWR